MVLSFSASFVVYFCRQKKLNLNCIFLSSFVCYLVNNSFVVGFHSWRKSQEVVYRENKLQLVPVKLLLLLF